MKAKQRGRAVEPADIHRINGALWRLKIVRDLLRDAGSHNSANYVQRCIKSTQGALNNAEAHLRRQGDQ